MSYRQVSEILDEVQARGMRKAFFVTALLLEMEAVRAHLTDMGSVVGRDGTIYECGLFSDLGQEWLVVVAETGPGTHPAQNVASQGHTLFGEFEVQILVGIGGSRKKDAPIGSVVASDKVYMPYSGKAGKGGFTNRPTTFPLDLRLVNIAKKVRRDKIWPTRIRPADGGTLPPFDAYPVGYPPTGLVAPIASIEAVLDDPESELEALLAQGYSDTCVVEMEGYGAVYAASAERTPSIIVRGVSDMTKDKSAEADAALQPLAACHAAAFAFDILSHWGRLNKNPSTSSDRTTPETPATSASPADIKSMTDGDIASTGHTNAEGSPPIKAAVTVVLNLSVDFGPEDWDRIGRIQALLREIATDEQIEIVEAQAGSLRLLVADPGASLTKLGEAVLRKELAEREGVDLLGIVSIEEFKNQQRIRNALTAASSELINWPATLPDGTRLERPEIDELRSRIDNSSSSVTVILGPPGAGKSALLSTLGAEYAERGWPVLALKADLIETDINSEAALRDRLGLDDLPSNIVNRLAAFGPILLVIDQLDALAGYVDLRTARLSILLNLVRKVSGAENVHIVLSSRTFEFHHDARLKVISSESLTLQLPAWSEVMAVLEARGVSAAGWPPDAKEVMRSPQALSTYLQLSSRYSSEHFTSYQAMLERLWIERILVGDSGPKRDQLASDIADSMADEESLWLAGARFTDRMTELHALTGAGVLTTLDGSVGFSHQTLFEFALARGFAREPGRLSKFVLGRQSSLFLRPKLWAGLTYLRATDLNAYHSDLEAVWNAEDLRPHLRVLLIDFLGSQSSPTDREALLLEAAVTQGEFRIRAFGALSGSEGWFTRFGKSFIAEAMSASEELANAQISVLIQAALFAPADVVALLQERWLPDPKNDYRVWMVIQSISNWLPEVLQIALAVVGRTAIAARIIDNQVGTLGVEQPEFALRLAEAKLKHDLNASIGIASDRAAKPRPEFATPAEEMAWRFHEDPMDPIKKVIEDKNEWDSLASLAEQSPKAFLEILWSWYVDAFDTLRRFSTREEHETTFPLPYDADYRFEGEANNGLPEPSLLAALRIAVERVAELEPDIFDNWIAQNKAIALTPVQRIIAHGIAHQPERFAAQGLDFILGDARRFRLGSINDLRGTSKALVKAIGPFWSREQTEKFEQAVHAYRPAPPPNMADPKDRMSWRHSIRRAQLDMLRSLPMHQMSTAARRQMVADERQYGTRRSGVYSTGMRSVGSVMEADAMAKANDDDVVNAFNVLPDSTGWDHPTSWTKGGNIQLARAFATFAKGDPGRAMRIIRRLNKETGSRAAAYSLDALSETASPELVFELIDDVLNREFDAEELRHSVARALEALSRRDVTINDTYVTVLEQWLQTLPIPDVEADGQADTEVFEPDRSTTEPTKDANVVGRSFLWADGSFEFLPGGAFPVAEALLHLRLVRGESDRAITSLTAYLDREKNLKVWAGLANFLPYLWNASATKRNSFLDRLFAEVPGLASSKLVARFLAQAHRQDPGLIDRNIDALQAADTGDARQAYGEIVGLLAIIRPDLEWAQRRLEEIVLDAAAVDARAGAALSAVHVFAEGPDRTRAASLLTCLLQVGGRGVWDAAFDTFRLVDELTPDESTIDVLSIIGDELSEAPHLDATYVVDRLATLLPHQAPLVGRIALGLVEKWKLELPDIRTATAMASSQLADLAVTLHRLGPETREVGTLLFEELIAIDAYQARQMLDEIDNRFRAGTAIQQRRRLPRRSERKRRRRSS